MIIVSQDKDIILNFNQNKEIWIADDDSDSGIVYEIRSDENTMGFYDTEERAKEVVQEIINAYYNDVEVNLMNGMCTKINKARKYEMPER